MMWICVYFSINGNDGLFTREGERISGNASIWWFVCHVPLTGTETTQRKWWNAFSSSASYTDSLNNFLFLLFCKNLLEHRWRVTETNDPFNSVRFYLAYMPCMCSCLFMWVTKWQLVARWLTFCRFAVLHILKSFIFIFSRSLYDLVCVSVSKRAQFQVKGDPNNVLVKTPLSSGYTRYSNNLEMKTIVAVTLSAITKKHLSYFELYLMISYHLLHKTILTSALNLKTKLYRSLLSPLRFHLVVTRNLMPVDVFCQTSTKVSW